MRTMYLKYENSKRKILKCRKREKLGILVISNKNYKLLSQY